MPIGNPQSTRRPAPADPRTEEERDYDTMRGMKEKLHDFRMSKIREALEDERKKSWIYVGNAFREPPAGSSSSKP